MTRKTSKNIPIRNHPNEFPMNVNDDTVAKVTVIHQPHRFFEAVMGAQRHHLSDHHVGNFRGADYQ